MALHIWCISNSGYAWRTAKKKENHPRQHVLMHRYLLGLTDGVEIVDHKNGVKTDNRSENLRLANKSTNGMNRGLQQNNKSGYIGVWYDKGRGKYQSYINMNGKRIHLGRYDTAEEAAKMYNEKALEIHGEFAKINEMEALK